MAVFDCTNTSLKEKSSDTEKVKTLQTHLTTLGYYNASVDGVFGPVTTKAVKAFQKAYNLKDDGWFGSESCKKMNQAIEDLLWDFCDEFGMEIPLDKMDLMIESVMKTAMSRY